MFHSKLAPVVKSPTLQQNATCLQPGTNVVLQLLSSFTTSVWSVLTFNCKGLNLEMGMLFWCLLGDFSWNYLSCTVTFTNSCGPVKVSEPVLTVLTSTWSVGFLSSNTWIDYQTKQTWYIWKLVYANWYFNIVSINITEDLISI